MLKYKPNFNAKDEAFIDYACKRYDKKYPNPRPNYFITNNFYLNKYVRITTYFNACYKDQLSLILVLLVSVPGKKKRCKYILDIPISVGHTNGHKHGYITDTYLHKVPKPLLSKITNPVNVNGKIKPKLISFYHGLKHGIRTNKKPNHSHGDGITTNKHNPNAPYIIGDVKMLHHGTMSKKARKRFRDHTNVKKDTFKFLVYNGFAIVRTYDWNKMMSIARIKRFAKKFITSIIKVMTDISKKDANKLYRYSSILCKDYKNKLGTKILPKDIKNILIMSTNIKKKVNKGKKKLVSAKLLKLYNLSNKIYVNYNEYPWGTKAIIKKDIAKVRNVISDILIMKK